VYVLCYCRETVEDCGSRETLEETGLTLRNVSTECILNVIWLSEQCHFVAVVLRGEVDKSKQQEPVTREPHKCEGITCRTFFFVN